MIVDVVFPYFFRTINIFPVVCIWFLWFVVLAARVSLAFACFV